MAKVAIRSALSNLNPWCRSLKEMLRARMNNHISGCRTGRTTDIFDVHVHQCGITNNNLKPPYFKVFAFMALKTADKLLVHEKSLQRRGYDTLNR